MICFFSENVMGKRKAIRTNKETIKKPGGKYKNEKRNIRTNKNEQFQNPIERRTDQNILPAFFSHISRF